MAKPRVLLAITAYNGEAFIERTLDSAKRIDETEAGVDVLVLDDASPAPGFSGRLAAMCAKRGIGYYRTPRNLGIPRNVSLGMLAAVEQGYDHVIISNSDVLYPRNVVNQLVRAARADGVGSVTAWSNNVSLYSLPNDDPDTLLADQDVVDFVSDSLQGHYGDAVMDIPAGISFCVLIPTAVVRDVGVMDPVFGRGYCEETDWSLRSLAAGYRIALAPGTFVYHSGRGSNLEAGLVSHEHTSVPENERIIDLRYPMFRSQVRAFASSGILDEAHLYGIDAIIRRAGEQFGYSIDVGWRPPSTVGDDVVRCVVGAEGLDETVLLRYRGFTHLKDVDPFRVAEGLKEYFGGQDAVAVNIFDRGRLASALSDAFPDRAERHGNYPARV
ncbi:glycosyltransferase family 2 protein [Nocardioides pocheonensis]|uniref:Glycosyltransferase family 2 protein n=1 Tax=Nocardioides pocheonensis TaxID=661485 RepID=A0A3N0GN53_9ACTN|nr:glycosyltransferase [Nocardioides pocheonensis]RNM13801.1 glycosyltransferase family 2 protein [Nocardioides pocheonensis]